MGRPVIIAEVYFELVPPSFSSIEKSFGEQTGLPLFIDLSLHLTANTPLDEKSLVTLLYRDLDCEKALKEYQKNKEYEKCAMEKHRLKRESNFVRCMTFRTPHFEPLQFHAEDSRIKIEFSDEVDDDNYFFESLLNVLHGLGGHYIDAAGNHVAMYSEAWKDLGKYEQYKEAKSNRKPKKLFGIFTK